MPDLRKQTGTRKPTTGQSNKPSVSYPTPDITNDFVIIERKTVDSKEQPIAYGTAHPTVTSAILADQRFELEEDGSKTRIRVYSARGTAAQQSTYNASQSFAADSNSHRVIVRTFLLTAPVTPVAKGTADSIFTECLLTKEEHQPIGSGDNARISVTRVFEALPSPWIYFTRYDNVIGTISGKRRSVFNTNQQPTFIGNTRTDYAARNESSVVLTETQETYPTVYTPLVLQKTVQGNIQVLETITFHDRLNPPATPALTGANLQVDDSPHDFPLIIRTKTSLPTDTNGNIILPPSRVEYDTVSFTFPGIIASWKARKVDGKVRANIIFWKNRMPLTMTVAARKVITYSMEEPDLTREQFWKVVTRPWAQMYFGLPDNTIHPPAPITLRGESIESNGVLYEISGGQSSDPPMYQQGQQLLIGGSSEQWWGGVWRKTLIYVREP